jgi:hypothetical protein
MATMGILAMDGLFAKGGIVRIMDVVWRPSIVGIAV